VGLSEMTKLAPARMISTLMAIWFMGASAAQWLAGLIARTTATETAGGQVLTRPRPWPPTPTPSGSSA
jgi:proton-dependent oligopeptide transporter, POT family